jgi:hypothetical protein
MIFLLVFYFLVSTTASTTTQSSVIASSSLTSFCDCSNVILSINYNSFNTTNTTYQWQASPIGQNIWSNINTPNQIASISITSQANSTDYQCQIIVVYPISTKLISTVVTVLTTPQNTTYCATRLVDCSCCGDNIDNFILIGELSTYINDLATNCSANSYDDRTQESVSLYENKNYTAQASTGYSGGKEQLSIWIDFNNNFQFESSEQVAYQPLNITYNTDVILAIPPTALGATIGVHRMRATVAYAAIPNPCGNSSAYGETHDYMVNILSSVGKLSSVI